MATGTVMAERLDPDQVEAELGLEKTPEDPKVKKQRYFDDYNVKAARMVLDQLTPDLIAAMNLTFSQAIFERTGVIHAELVEVLETLNVNLKRTNKLLEQIEGHLRAEIEDGEGTPNG